MRGVPRRAGPPAFVLVLLLVACYWRIGYAYGTGDHQEILPQVLRSVDPDLFPRDPYLLEEEEHFSVRSGFLLFMRAGALVLPLPLVVFLVSVGAWGAALWALYRVAFMLVPSRVAATLTVLTVLAVTNWLPGGSEFVFPALVPGSLAWPLALLALEAFARGRPYVSAAVLGVGAWFQPLIGLQIGLLLGLVALWEAADGRPREALARALGFGALFFLVAAPLVLPALLTQTSGDPAPAYGLSTYYVTAELRQPHHYLLFSQPPIALAQFVVVVAVGLGGLAVLRRRGTPALHHVRFALRLLIVIALLVTAYVALTEGAESLVVAKMQFLRLTALAELVLLTWAAGAAVALAPLSWVEGPSRFLDRPIRGWTVALSLALLTVALAAAGVGRPGALWGPGAHARTDLARAEAWVREATPQEALFLVPPSTTSFRSHALRSIVVDRKSTPFRDAAMHERLGVLRTVAPAPLPERGGSAWVAALDSAYHAHSPAGWATLAARFGADYALVDLRATPTPPAGAPAFRAGRWAVYRLR